MLEDRIPCRATEIFRIFSSTFSVKPRVFEQLYPQRDLVHSLRDPQIRKRRLMVPSRHRLFKSRQPDRHYRIACGPQPRRNDGGRSGKKASQPVPLGSYRSLQEKQTPSIQDRPGACLCFRRSGHRGPPARKSRSPEASRRAFARTDRGTRACAIHTSPGIGFRKAGRFDGPQGSLRERFADSKAFRSARVEKKT